MVLGRSNEDGGDDVALPLLEENSAHEKKDNEALYRKLEWRLVPIPFLISIICYVNRTNISLAAVDFMRDLNLSQKAYGTGAGLFFIPYVIFQIPSNYLLERIGAPVWLGIILIGWGLSSAYMSLVTSEVGYYVLRVLLGMFQAGAYPGVFYYSTLFFPERRVAIPLAWSMAGCYVAMSICAPLATGLLLLEGVGGWHGWQWLFLLEGIPAIILGFVTMAYLPKDPSSITFLSTAEKTILQKELGVDGSGSKQGSSWDMVTIGKILQSGKLWWSLTASTLSGIMRHIGMFWTPLWIQGLANGNGMDLDKRDIGHEEKVGSVEVALLSTIPYTLAVFGCLFFGWSSTRFKERKMHAFVACLISSLMFFLLPVVAKFNAVLAFVLMSIGIATGANGAGSPMLGISASCFSKLNKAFGFALANTIFNLSGYIGPQFTGVLVDSTHSYTIPIYLASALLFIAGLMFVFIKDKVEGKSGSNVHNDQAC